MRLPELRAIRYALVALAPMVLLAACGSHAASRSPAQRAASCLRAEGWTIQSVAPTLVKAKQGDRGVTFDPQTGAWTAISYGLGAADLEGLGTCVRESHTPSS